jgi:hypothetical protein
MLCIKCIAFVCYPPRSDTSHNEGLVGLYEFNALVIYFDVVSSFPKVDIS